MFSRIPADDNLPLDWFVIRPDGTHLLRIGAGGSARWLADGSGIALTTLGCGAGLARVGLDGKLLRPAVQMRAGDDSAVVSPDGRRIAFIRARFHASCKEGTGYGAGSFDLDVMNADGSGLRTLVSRVGPDAVPAWSPDSRTIAFVRDVSGGSAIDRIASDGTGLRRLVQSRRVAGSPPAYPPGVGRPAWSPDGRSIVFVESLGSASHVFVVRSAGGTSVDLTPSAVGADSPTWSPDGQSIAFEDNAVTPTGGSFVVPVRGGEVRFLCPGGGPSWSPDGSAMACLGDVTDATGTRAEIQLVPVAGGKPFLVTAAIGMAWQPVAR